MPPALAERADGVHVRGADGLLYFVPSDSGVPHRVEVEADQEGLGRETVALRGRGDQEGASSALFIDPGDGASSNLFIDPGDAASSALFIDGASSALFIDGASSALFIEPGSDPSEKLPA